jgi:1-acyl-sn-glycerol-3-phosphate acyltransferase
MHRLPLADVLPYRFYPPKLSPLIVRLTRGYWRGMVRGEHQVIGIDVEGQEALRPLLDRGDGVMLCPNHCGRADGLLMLGLADDLGKPACAMAAYQIFEGNAGLRHWFFPRLGIFPVDREGSDLKAFKAAVEIVARGEHPLVVFPEGEVYLLADRLTPVREGAAAIAVTAAKRLADRGKSAWLVPIGMKYRFPDDFDPRPAFDRLMDSLELRLTWSPRRGRSLIERIYDLAGALATLKELEYLGTAYPDNSLSARIAGLRNHLLNDLESRRLGKPRASASVPERIKELRRVCLNLLADPKTSPAEADALRRDLNDVHLVVQSFSYPGDYVSESPTVDRIAETLMKLDEDLLGVQPAPPLGPRRVKIRIGEPIDVTTCLNSSGKSRVAIPLLTAELETRMQDALDGIGPGRLYNTP